MFDEAIYIGTVRCARCLKITIVTANADNLFNNNFVFVHVSVIYSFMIVLNSRSGILLQFGIMSICYLINCSIIIK